MRQFKKCTACNTYSLKGTCPLCNSETDNPLPAKFSPQDKYASYRRSVKAEQRKNRGMI